MFTNAEDFRRMEIKKIAVLYLCRFANPPQASQKFLESLLRHPAGANFDLVYLLKGFPEGQSDPALTAMKDRLPCPASEVRVSDEFYMINALFEGAAQVPHQYIFPLSSWSVILADNWLAPFAFAFERVPGCVVAGATGSYDPAYPGGPYPNLHIRTSAFLIERTTFLALDRGRLKTKNDNYHFESGLHSMTRQLLANGGKAVVVGRNNQYWLADDWPKSHTFSSGQQENLLIADNQTESYEGARLEERKEIAKRTWGDARFAEPPGAARRVHRFFRESSKKLGRRLATSTAETGPITPARVRAAMIEAGGGRDDKGEEAFGYKHKPDGLYLQQDLEEYSQFVAYMANQHRGAKLALDIGIASGGQTKFLRDFFQVDKTIVVDLGQHHEFVHWKRIRPLVKSDILLEIIGDSHSQGIYDRLQPYAGKIDFAFIDGDHSFVGLMRDIKLAHQLCQPDALFVFHDTAGVPDCKRAFDWLCKHPDFELLRNFDNCFGISVFRCLYPESRQPFSSHEKAGAEWAAWPPLEPEEPSKKKKKKKSDLLNSRGQPS